MNTQNLSEDISIKMSEAATPAMAVGNRASTTRIVGVVALAYAASMIAQNAMFVGGVAQLLGLGDGTAAPTYGDPLGVVFAYHAANRGAVAVAALAMLVMTIPSAVVNQVEMSTRLELPVDAASPRNRGANPRVARSQPDRATHWRIQMTKPEKTIVKAMPPPKTRLWNT